MVKLDDQNFPPLGSKVNGVDRNEDRPRKGHVTNRRCTINDLPDELLLGIIDNLPSLGLEKTRRKLLLSLSRMNWRFHDLVAEKLYYAYNSSHYDPYLFLRTIIVNKSLAILVKHADLVYTNAGHFAKSEHFGHERYVPNAQDKRIIKEGMKALGIPNWKSWASHCNTYGTLPGTLHAAILMHTPSVKTIVIHGGRWVRKPPEWINTFKWANPGTSLERMHKFENLQFLEVEADEIKLTDLIPIFRHCSLQKLHLKRLFQPHLNNKDEGPSFRKSIHPHSNNLKELHIEDSPLETETLRVLLYSTQHLKAFKYTLSEDKMGYVGALDPLQFMEALRSHKTSLESCEIYIFEGRDLPFGTTFDSEAGWRDFRKLKYLSCPLDCITGRGIYSETNLVEKLPPSLVSFHAVIRPWPLRPAKEAAPALEVMATQCSTHLPLLAQVRISVCFPGLARQKDWARFTALISQTTIELVIENDPESKLGWEDSSSETESERNYATQEETSSESSGEVSLYSD
jgi:hypothetical protein